MKHAENEYTNHSNSTLCFCDYHEDCGDAVTVIGNQTSGKGLTVVCLKCRQANDLEAVSHRISTGVESKIREDKNRSEK